MAYKAFMSYTKTDDEHTEGYPKRLCERLSLAVRTFSGEEFEIFQETDLGVGQQMEARIADALQHVIFFIPIITPSFFNHEPCREQLRQFLERERKLKQSELILPIQLLPERPIKDPESQKLFEEIDKRKPIDWTELRKQPLDDVEVREHIERMAQQIVSAMDRVQSQTEPYTEDFEARILAENQEMRQLIQEMQAEFARQLNQMSEQIRGIQQSVDQPQQVDTKLLQVHELRTKIDNLMRQHNRADYNMRRLVRERDAMLGYLMQANRTLEARRTIPASSDGAELIFVPAALFAPGPPRASKAEHRQAERFVKAFYLDKYPVTNARFARFVEATGYQTIAEQEATARTWRHPNGPESSIDGRENHPVVCVYRADALAYAEWAGRRLPTRLEWERAMRGVAGLAWPWGSEWRVGVCNLEGQSTTPVDAYPGGVSAVGCWDMVGNVWEWLADDLPQAKLLLMGGSWTEEPATMPGGYKGRVAPYDGTDFDVGFRCAMDVPTESKE
jgi:formylglycine-generating enzyme required for sulfatase activity